MPAIQGVHAALTTPRRPDSSQTDLGAALDLVDFISCSGVEGIVLSGSTGEFPHFDLDDRLHLAQFAIRRSRVPVMVNVSHSSLDGALTLARGAASFGAAGLLLMPPHFFPYSQEDIREFYLRFAKDLDGGPPVLLYNVPAFTSELQFETVANLLATGSFAGVKDSSGSLEAFRRIMPVKRQTPFTLLIGHDRVFAEARAEGADGLVSGIAGVIPELLLGLDRAIRDGSTALAQGLAARLQEFIAWIERLPFPLALKEGLTQRGLKAGPPSMPAGAQTQARLGQFREWFQGWLPLVLKECSGA